MQTDFQGISTYHYTFTDYKMFPSTNCIGFFSLAYIIREFGKYKALEPTTERYFPKRLFLRVCSLHDLSDTCEVNLCKICVKN